MCVFLLNQIKYEGKVKREGTEVDTETKVMKLKRQGEMALVDATCTSRGETVTTMTTNGARASYNK